MRFCWLLFRRLCLSLLMVHLYGCTHVLLVKGVKVTKNGKESMHCVMTVNQQVITSELAQKAVEFCKTIEGAPVR